MSRECRPIKMYKKRIIELIIKIRPLEIKNELMRNFLSLAENFFSILKFECTYRVKLKTYEEMRLLIDQYIHFYNYERIQLKTKLTPLEKRNQFYCFKFSIYP